MTSAQTANPTQRRRRAHNLVGVTIDYLVQKINMERAAEDERADSEALAHAHAQAQALTHVHAAPAKKGSSSSKNKLAGAHDGREAEELR